MKCNWKIWKLTWWITICNEYYKFVIVFNYRIIITQIVIKMLNCEMIYLNFRLKEELFIWTEQAIAVCRLLKRVLWLDINFHSHKQSVSDTVDRFALIWWISSVMNETFNIFKGEVVFLQPILLQLCCVEKVTRTKTWKSPPNQSVHYHN